MILWQRVLERLIKNSKDIPSKIIGLEKVLNYLYNVKGLSLKQIEDLTDRECSKVSVREKMKKLGIKIKKRGGPNYVKPFTVSKEEYETMSYKELAFKYKVDRTTIGRRCKGFRD